MEAIWIPMDERQLRELLQWHRGEVSSQGGPCPDESELAAYFEGILAGGTRSRIGGHVADCDRCVQVLGFLADYAAGEVADSRFSLCVDEVPASVSMGELPKWSGVRRWAAAAVLVVAAGLVIWQAIDPPVSTVRQLPSTRDSFQGPQLLWPTAGSAVVEPESVVRWSSVPDSLEYTITLLDAQGLLLWQEQVSSTEIQLPALELSADQAYFLQIRSHLRSGKSLRSGHFELRIDAPR
jgi:hypothetical protein